MNNDFTLIRLVGKCNTEASLDCKDVRLGCKLTQPTSKHNIVNTMFGMHDAKLVSIEPTLVVQNRKHVSHTHTHYVLDHLHCYSYEYSFLTKVRTLEGGSQVSHSFTRCSGREINNLGIV